MKLHTLCMYTYLTACLALVPPTLAPLDETVVLGATKSGSSYSASLTAGSAKGHIPNWPTLSSSQASYDVVYFPQNIAIPNDFDMAKMLCLVNKLRVSRNLYPLIYHRSLIQSARMHAQFLAKYQVVTHADENGRVGDRLTMLGYRWRLVAENVGAGSNSEEGIVEAWSKSAGHLANMLHPDIRYMGASVSKGFWVQNFASPFNKDAVVSYEQIDACPSAGSIRIYSK
ncbi:hypothetical protein GGF42_003710 [Coemansia sp. RSA 2424]|nr:hypothetical protein GGF42_003710 [Coemansia sp. RSA 2424]